MQQNNNSNNFGEDLEMSMSTVTPQSATRTAIMTCNLVECKKYCTKEIIYGDISEAF